MPAIYFSDTGKTGMPNFDRQKIKELIELVEQNGLTELCIREKGVEVTIKLVKESGEAALEVTGPVVGVKRIIKPILRKPLVPPKELINIVAPMTGVFYRSAAPGAPALVEVGDIVEEEQPVGLLEAMKVFNEIKAEIDGKVVEILVGDEQLVEGGQILVVLERVE